MYRSKNIRLPRANYVGQQHYFVTICCFNRRRIFTDRSRCSWLLDGFRSENASRDFAIHAYCLMPDHFHFLVEGLDPTSDLLNLIKSFKLKTSRAYIRQTGQVLWQRRFFDHILRPSESPESVAWYIWLNPVRKSLSPTVEAYPFSGAFTSQIPRVNQSYATWIPPWRKPEPLARAFVAPAF
jgi:putative transposase